MKFTLGVVTAAMIWVVLPLMVASMPQETSTASSTDAVEYKNPKFSFTFSLPQGWKGYTIVTDQWEASDAQKGAVEHGPIVCIRHPEWTKQTPRQDIPIMVFTLAQWDSAEKGNLYVNGSPMSFHELGRNRKYAFAVSTRYNEADVAGREEVDNILQHEPLHPLWSK